jgi:hypothetical protein
MDGVHSASARASFRQDASGGQWAGVRSSFQGAQAVAPLSGSLMGLLAMMLLGLVLVAHTALAMQPRVANVRSSAQEPVVQAAAEPAPSERPEAVGPDPEVTENGFIVQPWRWHQALTVSQRTTLLANPGEDASATRWTIQEGRAIRVIGLVAVSETEAWLQVRTENGGVAYVLAEDVTPLPDYRERRRAEAAEAAAAARREAEAAELEAALGAIIDLNVPPSEFAPASPPSRPAQPGELY